MDYLFTISSQSPYVLDCARADQNTGGALLEFPMRTAMHLKSSVSSAISAIINKISKTDFSTVVVAQWVRH